MVVMMVVKIWVYGGYNGVKNLGVWWLYGL